MAVQMSSLHGYLFATGNDKLTTIDGDPSGLLLTSLSFVRIFFDGAYQMHYLLLSSKGKLCANGWAKVTHQSSLFKTSIFIRQSDNHKEFLRQLSLIPTLISQAVITFSNPNLVEIYVLSGHFGDYQVQRLVQHESNEPTF